MEHRWGRRVVTQVPVELGPVGRPTVPGCVTDVSSSGAHLDSCSALPPGAFIQVQFGAEAIPAYVVRLTVTGLAVEWAEFAPLGVCMLLAVLENLRVHERVLPGIAIGERAVVAESAAKRAA